MHCWRVIDVPAAIPGACEWRQAVVNAFSQRGKFGWVALEQGVAVAVLTQPSYHPGDRIGFGAFDIDLDEIHDLNAVLVKEIINRTRGTFEITTFRRARGTRHTEVAIALVESYERAAP